ncbi:MAG: DUF3467 domain-containing protein [Planctomycetota bacterium]
MPEYAARRARGVDSHETRGVFSMSGDQRPPSQPSDNGGGPPSEQVKLQHITARVPENVSRGAFSTGMIVMTGGTEFILDFIQNIGHPPHVAARIILPHATMPQFIQALRTNLEMYIQRFGQPPELPKPQAGGKQPSAQEIYDELKMPDSLLSGAYANGVMIGHTAAEFKLDFLTNLFPHSAVSSRVFLSAPQVPRVLDSLINTFQQFQQRLKQPPQPPESA